MKHVVFGGAFGATAGLVFALGCGSSGGGGGSLSCFSMIGTGSNRTCAWSRTSNESSCAGDSQEGSPFRDRFVRVSHIGCATGRMVRAFFGSFRVRS
jgi:hypothetical protein